MSSYLFTSKIKNRKLLRNMHKNSDADSNMSLDSLEENFKRKTRIKDEKPEKTVDTILVPFYEQDVLIKIPTQHYLYNMSRNPKKQNSYLMNKKTENVRKHSYLEMYRKKINPTHASNQTAEEEIRSITPEYGDTERESIGEDIMTTGEEFLNTEAYNEIYYERIIQQEICQNMDRSYGDEMHLNANFENKSPPGSYLHRSVSEITLPKRVSRSPSRRVTIEPQHTIKLGGLGPDVEAIKPRLERARSLQRYSEKVRMENRLKIYKKTIEAEKQKQKRAERQSSAKRQAANNTRNADAQDKSSSYLIKPPKNKNFIQKIKKNCCMKSAELKVKTSTFETDNNEKKTVCKQPRPKSINTERKERQAHEKVLTSRQKSGNQSKNININKHFQSDQDPPPVQISFMVNFNGIRPSSALKTLEAKHKMYQEKVKKFAKENFQ